MEVTETVMGEVAAVVAVAAGVQEAQGPGVGRDQGEGGAVHGLGGGEHARPHRPLIPAGRIRA